MLPWARPSTQPKRHFDRFNRFWASVCKIVCPMLLDRCPAVCLSYLSVCLSVLSSVSVCDVAVFWPNGWMDQDETWHAGRPRPWPHCDNTGIQLPQKGHIPQFSAHVYGGQTAGWIMIPLGMDVGLGPGDFVFDGDSAPPEKRQSPHQIFGPRLM